MVEITTEELNNIIGKTIKEIHELYPEGISADNLDVYMGGKDRAVKDYYSNSGIVESTFILDNNMFSSLVEKHGGCILEEKYENPVTILYYTYKADEKEKAELEALKDSRDAAFELLTICMGELSKLAKFSYSILQDKIVGTPEHEYHRNVVKSLDKVYNDINALRNKHTMQGKYKVVFHD